MKNRVTTFQHQNTKNQTVILIFQRYRPYLLICCVIYLNILLHCANALTLGKYLETTRGSEQREWYDKIIIKEKQDMCINIDDIHETIMFVFLKQLTHT